MYKRTKTGKNQYTTYNTKTGGFTSSYSIGDRANRTTFTTTSNGKHYVTHTTNIGGWVDRRRENFSKSPRTRKVRRNNMSFKYTPQLFLIACILFLLATLLGY